MSTGIDIKCLDCSVWHGFVDVLLYKTDDLHELITYSTQIANLEPLVGQVELRLEDGERISVQWFIQHGGHRLAVIDEYGARRP